MPRLDLPQVTLVCVDNRTPQLALRAIARCQAQATFAEVLLFTDAATAAGPLPAGVRGIAVDIGSVAAYSHFMLRGLDAHVHTSHLLVVQWDGWLLDAAQWDPAFLACDYIGAVFRDHDGERAVGNGGFSLRSKRLLQALQDPAMAVEHPEDTCICHTNRARLEAAHGIRFAPPALARRFAYERVPPDGPTLGFHGLFNLHRVLDRPALHALVQSLPDGMCTGMDARDLCRALIAEGELDTSALLLAKRQRAGQRDWRTQRLRLLWTLARWRRGGR